MAYPGLQLDPIFAHEFLDDPTVLRTSRLFLGDDCILVASDAQRIESWTHWHSDTPPEVDYRMMKCIMYLDEHSDGYGSVAVLPGSHHFGFASRAVPLARAADEAEEKKSLGVINKWASSTSPWMPPGAVTACTRPGVRTKRPARPSSGTSGFLCDLNRSLLRRISSISISAFSTAPGAGSAAGASSASPSARPPSPPLTSPTWRTMASAGASGA